MDYVHTYIHTTTVCMIEGGEGGETKVHCICIACGQARAGNHNYPLGIEGIMIS